MSKDVEELVCDFCTEPNPLHRIRCKSFVVHDPVPVTQPMRSIGDFLACTVCNGFILVENRRALLDRARQSYMRRHNMVWSIEAELELRQFYKQFWENRI